MENIDTIKTRPILMKNVYSSNYTLIDVVFDIWYITTNIKKEFVNIFIIFIILLAATWWIPTIYSLMLLIHTTLLWTRIIIKFVSGKELTISCDDEYTLFEGMKYKMLKIIKKPEVNAKIIVYFILGKRGKFDSKIVHTILINNVLPRPLWYIKILIYTSTKIYGILKDEEMGRKNFLGKISVIGQSLEEELEFYLLQKSIINSFADGKRIYVKKRRITTNFSNINKLLMEYRIYMASHEPMIPHKVKVGGKKHLSSLSDGIGIHYTSVEGENKAIKRIKIPLTKEEQYIVCGLYGENLIRKGKFLKKFFEKHEIKTREDYIGFWTKQDLILKSFKTNQLLTQSRKNHEIIILREKISLKSHIFIHKEQKKGNCPIKTYEQIINEEKKNIDKQQEQMEFLLESVEKPIREVPNKYKKEWLALEAEQHWEEIKKEIIN